jgi:hypothetical protein
MYRSIEEDFKKKLFHTFLSLIVFSMYFRNLSNFWKFKRNKNPEKQPHSAGPVIQPGTVGLAQRPFRLGRPKPMAWRSVTRWRGHRIQFARAARWRARRWRYGGRPVTRFCWRALGVIQGGAVHDKVSGSSSWCSAVDEAEEGFGALWWRRSGDWKWL